MNTKPTIETVLEYLKVIDARLVAMDTRMTTGFQEVKAELKLLNRKLELLNNTILDHGARIVELEEATRELTRPLPTN
jgi:hypothetical protein